MASVDESLREAFRALFAKRRYSDIAANETEGQAPCLLVLHGLVAAFAGFNREVLEVRTNTDHVFWMAEWIHDAFSIPVDELVRLCRKRSAGTWEAAIGGSR